MTDSVPALDWIKHGELYNPEALIPSQCYTKTDGVNNPCYVCHQSYPAEELRVYKVPTAFLTRADTIAG